MIITRPMTRDRVIAIMETDPFLLRTHFRTHTRKLDYYLDLAGCDGEARERAIALSPGGPEAYVAQSGWYLLEKRG